MRNSVEFSHPFLRDLSDCTTSFSATVWMWWVVPTLNPIPKSGQFSCIYSCKRKLLDLILRRNIKWLLDVTFNVSSKSIRGMSDVTCYLSK